MWCVWTGMNYAISSVIFFLSECVGSMVRFFFVCFLSSHLVDYDFNLATVYSSRFCIIEKKIKRPTHKNAPRQLLRLSVQNRNPNISLEIKKPTRHWENKVWCDSVSMVEGTLRGDDVKTKAQAGKKTEETTADRPNHALANDRSHRLKSANHRHPKKHHRASYNHVSTKDHRPTKNHRTAKHRGIKSWSTRNRSKQLPMMAWWILRTTTLWGVLVAVACLVATAQGSEFPERECCDPVYPPNTATTASAPVTHPVSVSKPAVAAGKSLSVISVVLWFGWCYIQHFF